jgi:hypothetical protein
MSKKLITLGLVAAFLYSLGTCDNAASGLGTREQARQERAGIERKVEQAEIPIRCSCSEGSVQKETGSLDKYIDAVIEIESHRNPNAERYEPVLEDTSYGLGQILGNTAMQLEQRHPELPRLGITKDELEKNLKNSEINRRYTEAYWQDITKIYDNDPLLTVAGYNSGPLRPRNARIQEMLNELYRTKLVTDGKIGKKSKEVVKKFQGDYGLKVDGVVGPETYSKLQEAYTQKFPGKPNPKGIVPANKITENHVRKFKEALEKRK